MIYVLAAAWNDPKTLQNCEKRRILELIATSKTVKFLLSNFLPPAEVVVVAGKSSTFMDDLLCVLFQKNQAALTLCRIFMRNR